MIMFMKYGIRLPHYVNSGLINGQMTHCSGVVYIIYYLLRIQVTVKFCDEMFQIS